MVGVVVGYCWLLLLMVVFLPSVPSSFRHPLGTFLSSSSLSERDQTPAEPLTLTKRTSLKYDLKYC